MGAITVVISIIAVAISYEAVYASLQELQDSRPVPQAS